MRIFVLTVTFLLLSQSTIAFAQGSGEKEMEALAIEANDFFSNGEFKKAASKFREAYNAFPDATLKKNEMIAAFKSGECTEAIAAGALYVDKGTDVQPSDREDVKTVEIRCRIRFASDHIDLERLDKANAEIQKIEALGPSGDDKEKVAALEVRMAEAEKVVSDPDPIDPVEPVEKPTWALYTGIGAVLVGLGAVGGGVGTYLVNERDLDVLWNSAAASGGSDCTYTDGGFVGCDIEKLKEDDDYKLATKDRDFAQPILNGLYIGGGVVAAAGIGLITYYILAPSGDEDAQTQLHVVPEISHEKAGVQLLYRF